MTAAERQTLLLPVPLWLRDHCFDGRAILPAVMAMRLMAEWVHKARPDLDVRRMADARFSRFLELDPAAAELEATIELEPAAEGSVLARLLTRSRGKTLTRMLCHCELRFAAPLADEPPTPPLPCPARPRRLVEAEQIYRQLVPFGPAFRTLKGRLAIGETTAQGTLLAPDLEQATSPIIGSILPLDGAMHAACVHGQQLVDWVPFPTGFADRWIRRPCRAGEVFTAAARLRHQTADQLVYDLWISDAQGCVREAVRGLQMRDVTGGRIRPPAWLREKNQG